ncbi:MAG TPA: hypothetical protein VKK81_11955 [Candidatus Binatia bacterium]|nr:hypothetical protein [Candidatus Binatia bacterium]
MGGIMREGKSWQKTLTRKEARAFQARWKMVNTAERAELRTTPLDRKLQQLAALMASVQSLGWTDALAAEEAEVRARWNRLRAARNG